MQNTIDMRKAVESDREQIAKCIAEGFEKDFSVLSKNTNTVAHAIEGGIQIDKFYIALEIEKVVGVLAISDSNGRSILTDSKTYRKNFGFFKGLIATYILKEEFEKQLKYPETVGYIEFVTVLNDYRRKGITMNLLEFAIANEKYSTYELDVTDINLRAINCYKKFGFSEYKREKVSHAKQKGFNEKVFMRYVP